MIRARSNQIPVHGPVVVFKKREAVGGVVDGGEHGVDAEKLRC